MNNERFLKRTSERCFEYSAGSGQFGLLEQRHHRLGGFSNNHLILTVLEPGKSKVKVPADMVSW